MTAASKKKAVAGAAIVIGVLIALFYFAVNPESSRFMPQCIFHKITGLDCPGCGSQRMIHSLLHGNFREAWAYNPFLLCMIPVILWYAWLDFFPAKAPRLFRFFHSPVMIAALGTAIILWGIFRNI